MSITGNQLLTKPDGNIMETLTDPRVVATALGAVMTAVVERSLWTSQRANFGTTVTENGIVKYYAVDPVTGQKTVENPSLGTNRQMARLALVVAAVAAIEYIPDGHTQYAFLGVASVAMAHVLQDSLPGLR